MMIPPLPPSPPQSRLPLFLSGFSSVKKLATISDFNSVKKNLLAADCIIDKSTLLRFEIKLRGIDFFVDSGKERLHAVRAARKV